MPNPSAVPIAIRFPRVHPSPALAGGKDVFVLCVVAIPEVEVDGKAAELVIGLGSVVDDVVVPVVAVNDTDKSKLVMLLLLQILAFTTYSDKKYKQ